MNSRETLDTQLNVSPGWKPTLSEASRHAEVLFLANIQPELQRDVLQKSRAKFVALDSMNLWIEVARDALVDVVSRVNCVILNDAELRQLTGQPNLLSAASGGSVLGPVDRSSEARRIRCSAGSPAARFSRYPRIRSRPWSIQRAPATPSPADRRLSSASHETLRR